MSDTRKDEELFGPPEQADATEPVQSVQSEEPNITDIAEPAPEPEPEAPDDDEDDGDIPADPKAAAFAAQRRALKKETNDWRGNAIRLEEQLKAAQAKLAELEKAQQAPPPPPAPPVQRTPIDPKADPEGFVRSVQLDTFEEVVRMQHGAAVDEALAAFETEAARNPVLDTAIRSARNPWAALIQWHAKHKVMSEIGDDPRTWQEKERERIRAELAAEMQASQPAAPVRPAAAPVPRAAPSLAGATAVAGRDASTFTGPTPMADILPNNRAFGG